MDTDKKPKENEVDKKVCAIKGKSEKLEII